jgi:hypothetical protein
MGSSNTTIRLWRVADGVLPRELKGYANKIQVVAIVPNGLMLGSVSWDGSVWL